jgi:hypothetical protein
MEQAGVSSASKSPAPELCELLPINKTNRNIPQPQDSMRRRRVEGMDRLICGQAIKPVLINLFTFAAM